jgi:hypothetical protein
MRFHLETLTDIRPSRALVALPSNGGKYLFFLNILDFFNPNSDFRALLFGRC